MDKQPGQDSESSRSISVPSRKYYIYDAKSSEFLDSFEEMFQPSVSDAPFLFRRHSLDSCFEYNSDGKQEEPQESERLFSEEMLSLARKKSEIRHVGGQYQATDAKSRALSFLRGMNGYPSLSGICYPRGSASNLLFPSSVYPASTDNYFHVKSNEAGLTPICKEEFASSQRAARAVPCLKERNKKDGNTNDKHSQKRNGLLSSEIEENRNMEPSTQEGKPRSKADESARYWERRRRNNASAKKSRDARRTRELQTQIKVAFLEKQNMRMLAELMAVRQENVCLRRVLSAQM